MLTVMEEVEKLQDVIYSLGAGLPKVSVQLLFVLGDHHALGVLAEVPQGTSPDRDVFSNSWADFYSQLGYHDVPQFSLDFSLRVFHTFQSRMQHLGVALQHRKTVRRRCLHSF